jgi:flavin-dependent dehydrogenase
MAVARSGYVGLTRLEQGVLNVAASFDRSFLAHHGSPRAAADAVLAEAGFPAIPELEKTRWKGTPGLTRRVRPVATDRVFLIGDACGYVEPFTGEGMAWAFLSAQAVIPLALRGIEQWEPALAREWEAAYRHRIVRRQRLCHGMASLLRHPRLMRGVFEFALRVPAAARWLIGRVNRPTHISTTRPKLT